MLPRMIRRRCFSRMMSMISHSCWVLRESLLTSSVMMPFDLSKKHFYVTFLKEGYLHAKAPPVAVILQLEVLFFNVRF